MEKFLERSATVTKTIERKLISIAIKSSGKNFILRLDGVHNDGVVVSAGEHSRIVIIKSQT